MNQEQAITDERNQPSIIAIMTTEHYNLQSGRAMTISDSTGRSSLFLSTVSITLVALAFVGQFSQLGTAFYLFALVLLPSLFFIGFVTFERVLQSAIEDFILARGINRLRHFYVELAPAIQDYFILSTHDDEQSAFLNMGLRRSPWQVFLTTPGMIAFIDSVLAGAFAGLLVSYLFTLAPLYGVAIGFGVFLVALVLLMRQCSSRWNAAQRSVKTLFPSAGPVEEAQTPRS
ncbi:MAG TPA: hypothetical protein VH393_14005 [Ktedonobacterales bacterium]|jgi:hypothetical protein